MSTAPGLPLLSFSHLASPNTLGGGAEAPGGRSLLLPLPSRKKERERDPPPRSERERESEGERKRERGWRDGVMGDGGICDWGDGWMDGRMYE